MCQPLCGNDDDHFAPKRTERELIEEALGGTQIGEERMDQEPEGC